MLTRVARLPFGAWSPPRDRAQEIVFTPLSDGVFQARIPAELRGGWVVMRLRGPGMAALSVSSGGSDAPVSELLLQSRRIVHVPAQARLFRLQRFGVADGLPVLRCAALSRAQAMLLGCVRRPWPAAAALARVAVRRPPLPLLAARTELARVILTERCWPDYTRWAALFDADEDAPVPADAPGVIALVLHDGRSEAVLAATLRALDRSVLRVPVVCVGPADRWPVLDCDYVALLQAGELPRPHALSVLCEAAQGAAALFADEDHLDSAGRRTRPNFKPHPSRLGVLSGALTRGVWLIRPEWLNGCLPRRAEALRREAALRVMDAGLTIQHVPKLLTHCRHDTAVPPAEACAHGRRGGEAPRISVLIASTLRRRRIRRCVHALLRRTAYPRLEFIVVVSQPGPLDGAQEKARARLETDRRVRVVMHRAPRFNYAAANNFAARHATGDLLCLLNDDVAPLHAGWLQEMARHFDDVLTGRGGGDAVFPRPRDPACRDRAAAGRHGGACRAGCTARAADAGGVSRDRGVPADAPRPVHPTGRIG